MVAGHQPARAARCRATLATDTPPARASDWLRVQQTVRAFDDLRPDHRRGPAATELAELAELVATHRTR